MAFGQQKKGDWSQPAQRRGKDAGPTKGDKLKGNWITGPGTEVKGRGKDTGQSTIKYSSSFDPNKASQLQKSAVGQKKAMKAKVYEAGSNILTREKRKTYDQLLKEGSRADDPRNWEFHYKAPKNTGYSESKGASAAEKRTQAFSNAKMRAQRDAKWTGKDVYAVKKAEYETEGIKGQAKQTRLNTKAMGRFGSTKTAKDVAAQKQASARRGSARQRAGASAFEADQQKKTQRIA
jgi:hypothetical protein